MKGVRVSNRPAPTREPQVAETGFGAWIDRAIALTALATGLSGLGLAGSQLASLDWVWVVLVGGSLLISAVLMPIFAWTRPSFRVPATLFAASVTVGLWTWQLAWVGPPANSPPWLWPCVGPAAAVMAVAWGNRVAVVQNLFAAAAYLMARVTPSGGGADAVVAIQDTLAVAVQPALVLVLFSVARRQAAHLDAWVSDARRAEAEATLREELVHQRAQLDAVIHDEVMTTLVAAARSTGRHDPHVTDLAAHALDAVSAQAREGGTEAFPPTNLLRLLVDVAGTVREGVTVIDEVDAMAPLVPHEVVRALAQAVREAVWNVERHAAADEVTLRVAVTAEGRDGVRVLVEVIDDGVGFDPALVSSQRLGIRLSLQERLRVIGGGARIASAQGEGTRVALTWQGGPSPRADDEPVTPPVRSSAFARMDAAPVALVAALAGVLYTTIALLEMRHTPAPGYLVSGALLMVLGTTLALYRFGERMSALRAGVVLLAGLGICWLHLWALPDVDRWSVHATNFINMVCLLTVLLRAGYRRWMAWTLALVSAGLVLWVALGQGLLPPAAAIVTAVGPVGWLIAVEMLAAGMKRVQSELDLAQRHSDEASADSATSFARLVVREVWLADLREQVGGMLDKLADPDATVTDADREACLALEGLLRDAIKAANLNSPGLSAAIMEARLRGVEVTLVDNRGAALDAPVRRATVRHLEGLVRAARSGRIIARTAPEGYDEAVTIVQVDEGASIMTRIGNDGTIGVRR